VVEASVPRQAVRGYELVLWGEAPTRGPVFAYFKGGDARAASFPLSDREPGDPKSIFVAEVPIGAACGSIRVESGNEPADTLAPRPRTCQ
jgi:hypothetical protein